MTITALAEIHLTPDTVEELKRELSNSIPKALIPSDLISINEAEKLGLSTWTIRRYIETGELVDYDPGKLIKFSQSEYVALCHKKQQEVIKNKKKSA